MTANTWSLGFAYEQYPELEEQFEAALDRSLAPRGPDVLLKLVGSFGLPEGSAAVDVGCGEGRYSIELARRLGLQVTGIDPVARHLRVANEALAAATAETPASPARSGYKPEG